MCVHLRQSRAWDSNDKIYGISSKYNALTDDRDWYMYPLGEIALMWTNLFMMQFPSLNKYYSEREHQALRMKNILGGGRGVKIPGRDAMEDGAARMNPEELRDILRDFSVTQRRNKALGKCKIDELQVVAIDGIETSKSKVKQCEKCLSRVHSANAMPEYYHRFVAMMYVGGTFHTFLDATMLVPRDGEEKEEGELTGAKRLMEENHALLGHFADVIVVDALYFNAPFITLVLACGMDVVVRLKDESRKPYKEAEKSIRSGHYHAGKFFAKNAKGHNIEVEVADVREVEMENLEVANSETGEKEARNIRVLRFTEHDLKNPDEPAKIVWVATTSSAKASTIWKIMHARWGIENNGFHQISTYYHVKHLYCHDAVEQCFFLALIAFNMREAYLMLTRARDFPKSGLTRTDATDEFWDSLQEHPIKCPINIYRKKRRIKKRRAA